MTDQVVKREICPRCLILTIPIDIHGSICCAVCKEKISPCCEGSQRHGTLIETDEDNAEE